MVPLGTHRGAMSTRAGRASVCVYGCSAGCMTTAPKVGRPPSWLVKGCTQGPREQVHVWQAGWLHLPSESLHEDLRAASTSGHTNIVRPHLLLGGETFPENHYQSLNRWSPWREIEAGHSEQWPATLSHFPGYRHSKQGCLQSEIYWSKHWTLAALSLARKRTSQNIDLPMLHGIFWIAMRKLHSWILASMRCLHPREILSGETGGTGEADAAAMSGNCWNKRRESYQDSASPCLKTTEAKFASHTAPSHANRNMALKPQRLTICLRSIEDQ